MNYVRYVGHKDFKPFNPLELAGQTEKIVCRGQKRKYSNFYSALHNAHLGGIESLVCGCCLRCVFCWSNYSRDFPDLMLNAPLSAEQIVQTIKKYFLPRINWYVDLTGGEPTIGKPHLFSLLDRLETVNEVVRVLISTNGVLLGNDKNYVRVLSKYSKCMVRISLKAGSPEGFQKRCGAQGRFYELPFNAIKYCLDEGVPLGVVAMADSRIMPKEECKLLIDRCKRMGVKVHKENLFPYSNTLYRLKMAKFDVDFTNNEHKIIEKTWRLIFPS